MAAPKKIARDVITRLREHVNPERCDFMQGYSPTSEEILGVPVPDVRKVVRETKRGLKGEAPADVLAVSRAILALRTFEGRQAAYEILAGHAGAVQALRSKDYQELGRGIDNWAAVDSFATTLAGQAWREGRISDAAIHRWARSKDRWWRRAALAATVPLNLKSRGGSGDPGRTLALCALLVDDHDPMVAKALSWALRTLVPIDPGAVDAFLDRHVDELAAVVLREVRNKLGTGKKNPKKRARP